MNDIKFGLRVWKRMKNKKRGLFAAPFYFMVIYN